MAVKKGEKAKPSSQAAKDRDALESRIAELEERLAATETRLQALETEGPGTFAPTGTVAAPSEPAAWQRLPERTVAPAPSWPPAGMTPPVSSPMSEPAPRDLERIIGANWLSKLGMLVLVLGVAFFLRYAIDQGWITIVTRVILGVAGGIALFATGDLLRWWDKQRFNVYAQVLAGGGAIITFFSLFAAYAFPEYRAATGITLELDATLLGLTAILLATYAAIRKTPVLAMEAVGLGVVTSLFGASFTGFSVVYTVILAGGVVAAATWRRWPLVLAAAAFSSFFNLLLLSANDVDPWHVVGGTLGLLGLFTIAPLSGRAKGEERFKEWWGPLTGTAWLASWALVLFSLFRWNRTEADVFDGYVTAAFALGGLALALFAHAHVNARWGWAAGFFLTSLLWPFLQFEGVYQAFALACLVLVAVAVWWRREHRFLRIYAGIVGALLVVRLAVVDATEAFDGVLPEWEAASLFGFSSFVFLAGWLLTARRNHQDESGWALAFLVGSLLWSVFQWPPLWEPFGWAALIAAAVGVLRWQNRIVVQAYAAIVAFLLVIRLVFDASTDRDLNETLQLSATYVVGTIALVAGWFVAGRGDQREEPLARTLLGLGLVLPLLYAFDVFEGFLITIGWASEAVVLVVAGFLFSQKDLRIAALAIFGLVLARIFFVDLLELDLAVRIITFMVVGGLLLLASFLFARRQRKADASVARTPK